MRNFPVIALVGQPNVGKSTLFNRLTRTRNALVADQPGLTRDRQYGRGKMGDFPYIIVDTGGFVDKPDAIEQRMVEQASFAIDEADLLLFLVSAQDGLSVADQNFATQLRRLNKSIILVLNKIDGVDPNMITAEFYSLGLGEPVNIAAEHGIGLNSLMYQCQLKLGDLIATDLESAFDSDGDTIKIAIIGRPNVGKSTLVNRILGEERVIVYDAPGTTRDSIELPFERDHRAMILVDTAGVRKRSKVNQAVEKFSVIKTLQAIEQSDVVVMVLDAQQGLAEQDATLLGYVLDVGRALVIAINKWDGLNPDYRGQIKDEFERRFPYLYFAKVHFISALHGSGVGQLFPSIYQAYESAYQTLATPELTRILQQAIAEYPPPLVRGRCIKLRYAHQGGSNPPLIVIHGNQTEAMPETYKRYLINYFRRMLQLVGVPIQIELKVGNNPYKNKRNKLTPRQLRKRKRMLKFVKH